MGTHGADLAGKLVPTATVLTCPIVFTRKEKTLGIRKLLSHKLLQFLCCRHWLHCCSGRGFVNPHVLWGVTHAADVVGSQLIDDCTRLTRPRSRCSTHCFVAGASRPTALHAVADKNLVVSLTVEALPVLVVGVGGRNLFLFEIARCITDIALVNTVRV